MDKKAFIETATAKLAEHSLFGWTVGFDQAKRRVGRCNYLRKLITLSEYFVENNTEDKVINTLLHEIAQAEGK